jgi:hypothetical protein
VVFRMATMPHPPPGSVWPGLAGASNIRQTAVATGCGEAPTMRSRGAASREAAAPLQEADGGLARGRGNG